jgi:hypothetical protein
MNLKKEKGPRVSQHHIGLERAANIASHSTLQEWRDAQLRRNSKG